MAWRCHGRLWTVANGWITDGEHTTPRPGIVTTDTVDYNVSANWVTDASPRQMGLVTGPRPEKRERLPAISGRTRYASPAPEEGARISAGKNMQAR